MNLFWKWLGWNLYEHQDGRRVWFRMRPVVNGSAAVDMTQWLESKGFQKKVL